LTSIQAVIGSAPGKLILAGEHSVVFGEPALVAAVGVRLRATVTESASEGIELELVDLGFVGRESLRGLLDYASQKRGLWLSTCVSRRRSGSRDWVSNTPRTW
jgi:galactokinase